MKHWFCALSLRLIFEKCQANMITSIVQNVFKLVWTAGFIIKTSADIIIFKKQFSNVFTSNLWDEGLTFS